MHLTHQEISALCLMILMVGIVIWGIITYNPDIDSEDDNG